MGALTLASCFIASLTAWAPAARAQDGRGAAPGRIDGVRIEAHVGAGFDAMLGLGARVEVPIVPDGFLRGSVRDELALSAGGDLFFYGGRGRNCDRFGSCSYDDDLAVAMPVAVEWNLHAGDRWSFFPEAGAVLVVGDLGHHGHWHASWEQQHTHWWIDPYVGGGVRYHFTRRNALVVRLSWPAGLQLGLTF